MHLLAFAITAGGESVIKVFSTDDTDTQAESIAKVKAWMEDKDWQLNGAVAIDALILHPTGEDKTVGPYVDSDFAAGDIDFLEFIHL